jgi:hypothetical protein
MWGLLYLATTAIVLVGLATSIWASLVFAAVTGVFVCFAWATK